MQVRGARPAGIEPATTGLEDVPTASTLASTCVASFGSSVPAYPSRRESTALRTTFDPTTWPPPRRDDRRRPVERCRTCWPALHHSLNTEANLGDLRRACARAGWHASPHPGCASGRGLVMATSGWTALLECVRQFDRVGNVALLRRS